MGLCAPSIVGPVSELNRDVRVQGQLAGAHVTIRAIGPNPRTLAKDVLSSADERIALLSFVTLTTADRLFAVQEFNGEASKAPPAELAIAVQPGPTSAAQLGHVGYDTHLYECGKVLSISGAVPGALVLTAFQGLVQGSGVALEGTARYGLNSEMSVPLTVSTFQLVPGLPPSPVTHRNPDSLPDRALDPLPPPNIEDPLKACQPAVLITGVIDGATVTVTRDRGPTEKADFDLPNLWFTLSQPLVEGETIKVVQGFMRCQRPGRERQRKVGPAVPIEVPHISGRLCAGSSRIPVDGLIPGAKVLIIFGDGSSYQGQTPPGVASHTFDIGDPLPAGQTVTVKQERCGIWGDQQVPPVPVEQHEEITVRPSIAGPLFDCARRVFVKDIHPNAQVMVFASRSGGPEFPISNMVTMMEASGSIAVNPYLRAPDEVLVAQWACGGQRLDSKRLPVTPHSPLLPPHIEGYIHKRVYEGATSVVVTGAIPGALIEVFTRESGFLGQATADPSGATRVDLSRGLITTEHLLAHQSLCGDLSHPSAPPEVVKRPDLDAWLGAHPRIAAAIIWQSPSDAQSYPSWPASRKTGLADAFSVAWNFRSVVSVDPTPNKNALTDTETATQVLDEVFAWPLFVSYVAQSLVVEIGGLVGWSIAGYSIEGLAHLFDSRATFVWNGGAGGYEITTLANGTALPCAPDACHRFMFDKLDASSRFQTIARLLDWSRKNLWHFSGGWDTANLYDQWQYRGLPPVLRMIQGTPRLSEIQNGIRHRTAGCWGTVGFLRAVLRTLNIPVSLVTKGGHALPHFIEDGLYLSHGDDPYDRTATTTPIHELPIDQAQFDAWFGDGVPQTNQKQNVGRRPFELALIHLPDYLLKLYCADMLAGRSHINGWVYERFKTYYSVAELEAKQLWQRMDAKITSLGGCGKF